MRHANDAQRRRRGTNAWLMALSAVGALLIAFGAFSNQRIVPKGLVSRWGTLQILMVAENGRLRPCSRWERGTVYVTVGIGQSAVAGWRRAPFLNRSRIATDWELTECTIKVGDSSNAVADARRALALDITPVVREIPAASNQIQLPPEALSLFELRGVGARYRDWHPMQVVYGLSLLTIAVGVAVLLGSIAFLVARRRSAPANQCAHCGYPLLGLPPNSPCPECGTIPAKHLTNTDAHNPA